MSSEIFYPDAHTETTSVDGWVRQYDAAGLSWADIVAGVGFDANDSSTTALVSIQADAATNKWQQLTRVILLFDTSSLPNDASIFSVVLWVYGAGSDDSLSITPDINVYSSNPASNVALVAGDYDSLGSTPFCDTPITYANWNGDGWNAFTFNAAGIAAISKTGITKLGLRNANYDVAGISPTWSAGQTQSTLTIETAEIAGAGYPGERPRLIINYRSIRGLTPGATDIVTLEALRNIEMAAMGRIYVDEQGNLKYESRFARNL